MYRTTKVCQRSRWLLPRAGGLKSGKTTVLMTGTEGVGALKKAEVVGKTYKAPDKQVIGLRRLSVINH